MATTITLPQIIRIVAELEPDDKQALYDYLHDTLPANGRKIVQVGGTIGTSIPEAEGDPIADLIAEVRREHYAHFNEEWEE